MMIFSHRPLAFLLAVMCLSSTCISAQNRVVDSNAKTENNPKDILIVYLSRTNNTRAVAEMIQERVGGDFATIEPKTPYSEDYQKNVDEVQFQNLNNILPPLRKSIDISKYEIVFVGFPTWGMQLPPPIKTFLNENDWTGKTIAPFNTNAGYGLGSSRSQLEHYCAEGRVTDIFSVTGGHEREGVLFVMKGGKAAEVMKQLNEWLTKIEMAK